MDFTIALTHFCEKHGPKSVLCTQVLPIECAICVTSTPKRERKGSFESYTTPIAEEELREQMNAITQRRANLSSPEPPTVGPQTIEQHPLFQPNESQRSSSKFKYNQQHKDICASCSFSVPNQVAAKLPEGAPGSLSKDGTRNPTSAPVLRSREFVCLGSKRRKRSNEEPSSSQESQNTAGSYDSVGSHNNCHDHTLTYLTAKSPYDPEVFATLRNSVLRALSGESLPHGMSEGPFCFGDSENGYTIAYSFRLTDSKARGRVRKYAFVALAGKDAYRAFKACPLLWEAFALMSKIIEQAAQRHHDEQEQQEQRERDAKLAEDSQAGFTHPSSFLLPYARDNDGKLRGRAAHGHTVPMNLAEIIGDETIFAVIHQYFVHVLRRLGDKFGGLPVADGRQMVYQTTVDDGESSGAPTPTRTNSDMLADMTIDDNEQESATISKSSNGTSVISTNSTKQQVESVSTVPTTTRQKLQQSKHASLPAQSNLQQRVAV